MARRKKNGFTNLAFTVNIGNYFYVGDAQVNLVHKEGNEIRIMVSAPADVAVDRRVVREQKQNGRGT